MNTLNFIFLSVVFNLFFTLLISNNVNAANENSITFIVGEDQNRKNPYYKTSELFFRFDSYYKTEIIEKSASSLEEIVNYLNSHKPPSGAYWKTINIVNHSSEYGLNMPLYKNGVKPTSKTWQEFDHLGFPKVIKYLSRQSLITLWGCSFGSNTMHLHYLSDLFRSVDGQAELRSPSKRIFFKADTSTKQLRHYYADEYVIHSDLENYSDGELALAFQMQYPHIRIDWEKALSTPFYGDISEPTYSSESIVIKFYVPIDVIRTYRTLHEFMRAQPEIMTSLSEHNVQLQHLNIDIQNSNKKDIVLIQCSSVKHSILVASQEGDDSVMVYASR